MADPASYTKGDWTNLVPAATKAKMDNIENGIKANNDALVAETDAGRAITQAADAAAQRSALGLGDSATKNVGTGSGDVAAGDAPAAAQAAAEATAALDATAKANAAKSGAEATAAGALAGHVAAADPHTQYAKEADLGDSATLDVGTGAGDVAAGNAPADAVTTHESTYAHANLPTADEKTRLGDIQDATGATTAAKLVTLVNPTATQTAGRIPLYNAAKGINADGISFPATQVPSADANTLDDYEKGTFTPLIAGNATIGSHTYSIQVGFYTKKGREVTLSGHLALTKDAGMAGNMYIAGAPFVPTNTSNYRSVGSLSYLAAAITATAPITIRIQEGDSKLYFRDGLGYLDSANLSASPTLNFSITYIV